MIRTRSAVQRPPELDSAAVEEETLRHFQAVVQMDTTDPPGGEKPVAEYLKMVLEREGIPVQLFALEPNRPNIVARLKATVATSTAVDGTCRRSRRRNG